MDIGMLWFDDGPGSVKEKVARAAEFYAAKYGQKATVCMAHPDTLGKWEGKVAGIEVLQERAILPHHFWIGVEELSGPPEAGETRTGRGRKPSARAGRAAKKKSRKAASDRAQPAELRPAA